MSGDKGNAGRIDVESRGTFAVIRLARPEKLNALTRHMKQELRRVLAELEANREVRSAILTGDGGRAFCAGTDIGDLAQLNENNAQEFAAEGQQLAGRFEHFPKPVIAAINGIAAGGGTEIALGCHLRLASRNAQFSLPEIKLGIIPGYGGTQRLMRAVGTGHAMEMILTGKSISAQEAERLGLINRVVEPEKLMLEAEAVANQIAQFSPLAIRAALKAIVRGRELPLDQGLALERELFGPMFATEDTREGTRAFLEKRKPVFRGQ